MKDTNRKSQREQKTNQIEWQFCTFWLFLAAVAVLQICCR